MPLWNIAEIWKFGLPVKSHGLDVRTPGRNSEKNKKKKGRWRKEEASFHFILGISKFHVRLNHEFLNSNCPFYFFVLILSVLCYSWANHYLAYGRQNECHYPENLLIMSHKVCIIYKFDVLGRESNDFCCSMFLMCLHFQYIRIP